MENEYIKYWKYMLKMNTTFLRHNEEMLELIAEQLALYTESKSDIIKKMYGDKSDIEKTYRQIEETVKNCRQSIDFANAQLEMYNLSKGNYLTNLDNKSN